MRLMKYKLIIILSFMAVTGITLSQPTGIVQFLGGYSLPMGDLHGDFPDTWGGRTADSNTYFMKSGVNYGIYVKFPLMRKSSIMITGGIGFDDFSNDVSYNDTSGRTDLALSQSILGVALGAEYSFHTRKSKLNPYIGAEFTMNIFAGKLVIDREETTTYTMSSTVRYGIQFGAGADYVVHNNIGIVIGAKYAYANLFGKDFKEDVGKKYNLGDGEHELNGAVVPEKKITFLHFYGGISFYFGR